MQFRHWVFLIFFASLTIQAQLPPPLPTWQDEIAKNFVPYHQLTTADFPINDMAHPETSFWLSTFLHYYYHSLTKSTPGGVVYAYVTDWTIFFRSQQERDFTAEQSKQSQGRFAALAPGEFPSSRPLTLSETR
jgi:hypothetical protein